MMLCPCCGCDMSLGARDCSCGARFVGDPLSEAPIKVKRFGPVMTAASSLALVTLLALVFNKWFALAGVLVIWAQWRAMRLARRNSEEYGGRRVAAAMLVLTIAAGAVACGYAINYASRLIENREMRRLAATRASMYHVAGLLERYRQAYGSYPSNLQVLKKTMNQSLPADFWDKSIGYQSYTEAIADRSVGAIAFNNFELRSAGPDGKIGTGDDIIMRDGIFYTSKEIVKQPILLDSADH